MNALHNVASVSFVFLSMNPLSAFFVSFFHAFTSDVISNAPYDLDAGVAVATGVAS